jgi:hypothetical protein
MKTLAVFLSMMLLIALPPGCSQVQAEPAPITLPTGAEAVVNMCVSDVAVRMAVPEKAVKVISVFATEFKDASLGCPQPGNNYADVVTPGYIVKLEAAGMTCEYHTDETSSIAFYKVADSNSDAGVEDCCVAKTIK